MCCVHLCQCVHLELPGCHCFKHSRKTIPYTCLRFASFSLYLNTPTRCQGSGGERRQIITVHPNLDSTFLLIMMLLLSIKKNMPHMTGSHGTACLALSHPRLQYCWFTTQNRTSLILQVKKRKVLFAQPHVLPNLYYCISYANTKEDIQKNVCFFFLF